MGNRIRFRKIVNIGIVIAVALSWIAMTLFGEGTLAENGLGNLKYFTVLSNLFEGIASLIWLISQRSGNKTGHQTERIKYIAAASVALTFTVVMGFLGPLYGYASMFRGANLFFHLIIPVVSMAEIMFSQGVLLSLEKKNLDFDLMHLLKDGAIQTEDLEGFSQELIDRVNELASVKW